MLDNTILEAASAKLLDDYRAAHVFKMGTNQDFEGEVGLGQPLKIFTPVIPESAAYDRGTTITYQDVTPGEQVFTVSQYKTWGLEAEDLEKRFAKAQVWERTIRNGAWRFADDTDTYIADLMVAAVPDNTLHRLTARTIGLGLNANAYESLVDLQKLLENLDVPMDDCHVFVPPTFEGFLLKDDRYVSFNTPEAQKNLRGQSIGRASFMTVHKTTKVPTDGDYSQIVACHRDATTYAELLEDMQALPIDKDDFKTRVRSRIVFDGKVVMPRGLVMVNVKFAS